MTRGPRVRGWCFLAPEAIFQTGPGMTIRLQHLLLVLLFTAGHLLAQPLASASACTGGGEVGAACCCCQAAGEAGGEAGGCTGCCEQEEGDGSEDQPSDGDEDRAVCLCMTLPPALMAPDRDSSTGLEPADGLGAPALNLDPNHSDVWPSAEVQAARPPDRWGQTVGAMASRAAPALLQVFRL